MLRNLKDIESYKISATDGEIGHVKDFYFDDDAWAVRYFVVETGTWFSSRKVLITPISVHHPDWMAHTLPVSITKEQVRNSPSIDTDKPVSRQYEEDYLGYYGYPIYWSGGGMWGQGLYPYGMALGYAGHAGTRADRDRDLQTHLRNEQERHRNDDPHLRSCNAVVGHHVHATDGDIGHVSGFLVDDETWAILYLIVDTSNWWGGQKVLIAPSWVKRVFWSDQTVSTDLTRDSIRNSPHYDPTLAWDREQELALYRHYGRKGYWADHPVREEVSWPA